MLIRPGNSDRGKAMLKIKDIMTKEVITVKKTTSLMDALKLMKDNNIRHLPIIDESQKLINFISHRDIIGNNVSNKKFNYILLAFALVLLPAILIFK